MHQVKFAFTRPILQPLLRRYLFLVNVKYKNLRIMGTFFCEVMQQCAGGISI